jgi:hypothetical protein
MTREITRGTVRDIVRKGLEVIGTQRFFSVLLIHPMDGLQKIFSDGILQSEKEP